MTVCLGLGAVTTGCGGAKLATANEQMARGEYFDASKTYRKIYNKLTKKEERPLRGEVAFKMAECHRRLSQFQRAAAAYQIAIRYEYPDTTAYLRLAEMQHASGLYAQAVKSYENYLSMRPESAEAQNGLAGARAAADKSGATRYVVRKSEMFNSPRSDFSPMFMPGATDRLYFATTR